MNKESSRSPQPGRREELERCKEVLGSQEELLLHHFSLKEFTMSSKTKKVKKDTNMDTTSKEIVHTEVKSKRGRKKLSEEEKFQKRLESLPRQFALVSTLERLLKGEKQIRAQVMSETRENENAMAGKGVEFL